MEIEKYLKDSRALNETLDSFSKLIHNFIRTIPRPIFSISKEIEDPCLIASIEESENYESILLAHKDISSRYPEFVPFSEEEAHIEACIKNKSIIDDLYFTPIENALSNVNLYESKKTNVIKTLQSISFELNDIDFSYYKDFTIQADLRDITVYRIAEFINRIESYHLIQNEHLYSLKSENTKFAEPINTKGSTNKNLEFFNVRPKNPELVNSILHDFKKFLDLNKVGKSRETHLAFCVKKLNKLRYFTGTPEAFNDNDNLNREANLKHLYPLVKHYLGINISETTFLNSGSSNDLVEKFEIDPYS